MKLEKALRSIIDLIIQCCDPDEIVLFGSYAKGNDHPGSDLDILVIGNFKGSKYLRVQEMKDLLDQYPIRIDLHLVTPEEIAVESRKPFTFLNTLQSNSISLYKKQYKKQKQLPLYTPVFIVYLTGVLKVVVLRVE